MRRGRRNLGERARWRRGDGGRKEEVAIERAGRKRAEKEGDGEPRERKTAKSWTTRHQRDSWGAKWFIKESKLGRKGREEAQIVLTQVVRPTLAVSSPFPPPSSRSSQRAGSRVVRGFQGAGRPKGKRGHRHRQDDLFLPFSLQICDRVRIDLHQRASVARGTAREEAFSRVPAPAQSVATGGRGEEIAAGVSCSEPATGVPHPSRSFVKRPARRRSPSLLPLLPPASGKNLLRD